MKKTTPMLLLLLLQINSTVLRGILHRREEYKLMQVTPIDLETKMGATVAEDDEYKLKMSNIRYDLERFLEENFSYSKVKKSPEYFRSAFLELTVGNYKLFNFEEKKIIFLVINLLINTDYSDITLWKKQIKESENLKKTKEKIVFQLNQSVEKNLGKYKLRRYIPLEEDEFTIDMIFEGIEMGFEFKLYVDLNLVLGESIEEHQKEGYLKLISANFNIAIELLQKRRIADPTRFNTITGSFGALYEYLNGNTSIDFKAQRKYYFCKHFAVLNNLRYQIILPKYRPVFTEYAIKKMIPSALNMKLVLFMILQSKSSIFEVYKEFFDFILCQTLPGVNDTDPFLKQLVCLHSIFSVYKEQEKLVLENFRHASKYLKLKRVEIKNSQIGISTELTEPDECLSNLFSLFLLLESLMAEKKDLLLNGYRKRILELLIYIKKDISVLYDRINKHPFLKAKPVIKRELV